MMMAPEIIVGIASILVAPPPTQYVFYGNSSGAESQKRHRKPVRNEM